MEIIVKVQIDISEDTKAFVSALFGNQNKAEKPLWMQKQEEVIKEVVKADTNIQPMTKELSNTLAASTKAPVKAVATPASTPPLAAKATPVAATGAKITLTDVRAKAAPLVEAHRPAIMEKLRELGVANVSSLQEDNFPVFIAFLDTLK